MRIETHLRLGPEAQYPEAVTLEMATQEWLQLKNLLEITAQRATQSAKDLENLKKSSLKSPNPPQKGAREAGR